MAESKKTAAKAAKPKRKVKATSKKAKIDATELNGLDSRLVVPVEEPITEEVDIAKAAVDAAEQEEQAIVDEKRGTEPVAPPEQHKTIAKAGKRSAKALQEDEEKLAKEKRKASKTEDSEIKSQGTQSAQKPRTAEARLKARGKKYRKAYELLDKAKEYNLTEALDMAIKTSTTKFDATIELHINLGVDPKHADQNIRGNLVLPAGTGKTSRIAVFAETDDAAKAKKVGADIVGIEEITDKLAKEALDFDVLIATPATMSKLGKYARLLGPKGLMPNPKSGTVTTDVAKAVTEAKAGRVEYRVDSTGIVHLGFGKVSFSADKLRQNASAVLDSIKNAKPTSTKGSYIKAVHITTSMGPSIRLSTSEV